jgi:cation diffusion facilitator CzcD-associated flavoprotein CzcO
MRFKALPFIRHFTTAPNIKPKICVVGSGPAGFYAAQYMATRLETAEIDIFERLPVPFGLVRYFYNLSIKIRSASIQFKGLVWLQIMLTSKIALTRLRRLHSSKMSDLWEILM